MIALLAAAVLSIGTPQNSTSYCLQGRMADGSYTRSRSLAHNGYPLGTRVWVTPAVRGLHRWVVRDRIGWGSQADFWTPSCAQARAFGRRTIYIRRGWRR
jgi:3D (Asp-Asp-Asp) domain-containing protein